MRTLLALFVAVALAGLASPGHAAAPTLDARLARALTAPGIAANRTAAVAVDLQTGATVYSANARCRSFPPPPRSCRSRSPPSVSSAPPTGSGPRSSATASRTGRTWDGDLDLVGYGDPTLAESDLAALARDVAAWGIRRVTGRVVADESYFDARRDAPGWNPSYVGIESRPLSALSVDGPRFAGANGSASAAARLFDAALERRGVAVRGRRRRAGTGRPVPRSPSTSPNRSSTSCAR